MEEGGLAHGRGDVSGHIVLEIRVRADVAVAEAPSPAYVLQEGLGSTWNVRLGLIKNKWWMNLEGTWGGRQWTATFTRRL